MTLGMYWVIKSRRLIWAGHVARMEEDRSAFKILTGKPIEKKHLGRLSQVSRQSCLPADKGDEMIPRVVYIPPVSCLTAEEIPGKPQSGDRR